MVPKFVPFSEQKIPPDQAQQTCHVIRRPQPPTEAAKVCPVDSENSVLLQDVSRHFASDGFLTQTRSFAESGGRADAPTTSDTRPACPCETKSGCFRPSDRLAGWDSHPLEIADFHGILVFWDTVRSRLSRLWHTCAAFG